MSESRLLGKYELQAAIGKGPRAVVYRGVHTDTAKAVAIKVFAPDALRPQALDSFRKYAPVLARVRHPGITGFIEMVEADGQVAHVWELFQGAPLSSLLVDGAYPEPKKAWDVIRVCLETLAYLHQQGVVHRDIKPSNVLVSPEGAVVLTDVAVPKLYAQRHGVEYFSPEHFARTSLTDRSDLYQMGVLVYQLVTGKLPFTGTPAEIEQRVAQERPTDPSSHNNHLAWQLDWVVQKAMSKDPAERYAGAIDFANGVRLGLQDTVGRGLVEARAPAAAPLLQNAKVLAAKPAVEAKVATLPPTPPPPKAAPAPETPGPVPRPVAVAAASDTTAKVASDKPGVLFVDDDPRILTSLRALFRQDYDVQTAEGGEAALAILARGGIRVIVSDQRMPGMTGVELLRQVRTSAPNVVRLLLTGYTDLASLVGSINQGEIFRFVMKPWENDELKKSLAEAMAEAAKLSAAAQAAPQAPRSAGSLLVIDRTEGVARGLERLLAGAARVIRVETAAEAAKVISREEVAALVADMGSGMEGLVALFREVKAKRPGVLSILLTDEPDSELAIELINRAQIFRLLPKPVSARDLRTQVADALRRYSVFKQRVVASAAGADALAASQKATGAG
ncbi:MAG TPA: response regulator [Usitatibacter sp.]|nr:response regulator [Usitatibacter sp.]